MKIKKLSMLGFKSFMDRLEISFPLGISGVVGPNGCGKSNVVDAIRWCMGEQSPKQLRGRGMEDMIFNGSKDHKPMGMAEVSLVLENGDGSFFPPFSGDKEISVTRRLYRSGESEYRINNVPCRLKDIQDIFMDTGLGNKAYSIIGQGKIGSILEQRPEDTRVMLEEAAGITKYRRKVEESEKKIELAEINLQRIEDVLGEVQKQIRSLKRQASKASTYKNLSEKIQNLEIELYSNTYSQLAGDSGDKKRSAEELNKEEIAISSELSIIHSKIEEMNLELEGKDDELSRLRNNYLSLRERVHKKESSLEGLSSEIKMQEELILRLKAEKGEVEERLEKLNEERAALQRDSGEKKEKAIELEGEIAVEEKRVSTRRESLKKVKEDYERIRNDVNSGRNQEVGLNHESGYLKKMLNGITDSNSRLEKELKEVEIKIERVVGACEKKGFAREETAKRLKEIEAFIENKNVEYEDLEQKKLHVESEVKSVETNLNACSSRFSSLQTLVDNFEGYKAGVRAIMKANDLESCQKGHILGIVADVISVEHEYEQAVEAVLSDKLQYIIVESQEDGRKAVDYLKTKARGRGSFISVNNRNGNGKGRLDGMDFPLLREKVSVSDSFKSVVDSLLGDTVLVNDLEDAISIWEKTADSNGGRSHGLCLVTADGDMVDQNGVITGGKFTQGSSGLLARKRELMELEKKSAFYKKEIDILNTKFSELVKDIEEKKAEVDDLTEDKWECQEEINEFDRMNFRLSQELDQLEKLRIRISEDIARKFSEHERHRKELQTVEEKLSLCKARREEEEVCLQEKEIDLKVFEEEFELLRDNLVKLKADSSVLKEEQRGIIRETERLAQFSNDSVRRIEKIEEEIASAITRCEECLEKKELIKDELAVIYMNMKRAENEVNSFERERQDLHNEIKGRENDAEGVRMRIASVREKINAIKMEHSEILYKIKTLEEVVREKFNLVLPDIYKQYLNDDFSNIETEAEIEKYKRSRKALGEVNLTAIKEHEALKERYEFIKTQREDLIISIQSLRTAITKINRTSVEKFEMAFHDVDAKLKEIFPILFGGGTAGLKLTDETRPLESGVLVEVRPPGKKLSHMGLLSGGEKALVAMAFLFAIYMIKPSPFCLLDEVDAPLDEANINRFNNLLKEIQKTSQIIMVTHNRRTMEIADRLYGFTMEKAGVSSVVSVDIYGMKNPAGEGLLPGEFTRH
ncbi:MAG: chromosome segregation protein SMC [Deltaproteobacteria bacterium]|nr:chromosome segregation protein SMC [Deltaproteobacteria bacterium]